MATASFTTPGTPLTMAALKTFLDAALGELLNRHRGASAPDSPVEGQLWWDTSGDPVDTLKRYTVAAGWKSLLTVNKTTGAVTIQSLTLTAAATGFTIAGGTTSKTLTLDTDVTATNLMLKTGSNLAIGSDADGDMYYRASSVLARLAKGTANHKLFMNAGATAPEWANGMKLLSATYDLATASGNQDITGAGFLPSMVLGFATVNASYPMSIGLYDGTSTLGLHDYHGVINHTHTANGNFFQPIINSGAYQNCSCSLISDGVRLSWSKTGAPTGTLTIYLMCFR